MTNEHENQKVVDGQTLENTPEATHKSDELTSATPNIKAEISEKEKKHGVKLLTVEAVEVDIYDFDKTAIAFDSTLRYWGYCMVHNPWILIFLPLQFVWGVLMGTKIISVKTCKKIAFWYAIFINNQRNVEKFWDKYEKQIYDFFRPENRTSGRKTVLISASPNFLIEEISKRMKIDYCIATTHSKKTYTLIGNVCRRAEKVERLKKQLPNIIVKDVYSDSIKSDKYIFNLGERCFLATKGVLTEIEKPTLD